MSPVYRSFFVKHCRLVLCLWFNCTVSFAAIFNSFLAPPSPNCEQEMISYRKMLLSDYQITPEITAGCSQEITQKCKNGLEKDGRTLHCLFGLAQEEAGLGPQCTEAVGSSYHKIYEIA